MMITLHMHRPSSSLSSALRLSVPGQLGCTETLLYSILGDCTVCRLSRKDREMCSHLSGAWPPNSRTFVQANSQYISVVKLQSQAAWRNVVTDGTSGDMLPMAVSRILDLRW